MILRFIEIGCIKVGGGDLIGAIGLDDCVLIGASCFRDLLSFATVCEDSILRCQPVADLSAVGAKAFDSIIQRGRGSLERIMLAIQIALVLVRFLAIAVSADFCCRSRRTWNLFARIVPLFDPEFSARRR